jgi:hypothetical protein
MLTSTLLNELQKEGVALVDQKRINQEQAATMNSLNKQVVDLKSQHELERASFDRRLANLERTIATARSVQKVNASLSASIRPGNREAND